MKLSGCICRGRAAWMTTPTTLQLSEFWFAVCWLVVGFCMVENYVLKLSSTQRTVVRFQARRRWLQLQDVWWP